MKKRMLFLITIIVFAFLASACRASQEELDAAGRAGAEQALANLPAADSAETMDAARQGASDAIDRWVASQPPTPENCVGSMMGVLFDIAPGSSALVGEYEVACSNGGTYSRFVGPTATPAEPAATPEQVAEEEEATPEPAPTPTATPITVQGTQVADATIVATRTLGLENPDVVLLDGMVALAGFPEVAETVRWGFDLGRDESQCGYVPLAWLICEPGVLSFDNFNGHDENNPSAVWSGGSNVDNTMSSMVEQFLLPGNGYMKTNWAGGWIRFDDFEIFNLPTDDVSYMFVARGTYAEESGGQTPVEYEVTHEDYRGAAKIMRYPIEDPTAAGFYSWDHFHEDVLHQLAGDNCDYDGCSTVIIIAVDKNRGNITVVTYTAGDYQLIYTNSRSE